MQQLEAKRCFQTRGLGCRVYGEPRQSRQGVAAALRRLLARPCNMPAPSQASRSLPQPAPALSAVREQTTVDWCHAKNTVKETGEVIQAAFTRAGCTSCTAAVTSQTSITKRPQLLPKRRFQCFLTAVEPQLAALSLPCCAEAPADLLLAPPVSLGKRQACASVPQDMLLSGDRLRHLPLRTDLDFIVDAAQVGRWTKRG